MYRAVVAEITSASVFQKLALVGSPLGCSSKKFSQPVSPNSANISIDIYIFSLFLKFILLIDLL
jgi:hypothetical protein